jgi:hypothetical protein
VIQKHPFPIYIIEGERCRQVAEFEGQRARELRAEVLDLQARTLARIEARAAASLGEPADRVDPQGDVIMGSSEPVEGPVEDAVMGEASAPPQVAEEEAVQGGTGDAPTLDVPMAPVQEERPLEPVTTRLLTWKEDCLGCETPLLKKPRRKGRR